MNSVTYRFESETPPVINLRLKIEINCREHFTVFGYYKVEHIINNGWYSGSCVLNSFVPEEILGTKLRALYQRRKSRDLFDIFYALTNLEVDIAKIVRAYNKYIAFSVDQPPSRKEFIQNVEQKIKNPDFGGDIYAILRPEI